MKLDHFVVNVDEKYHNDSKVVEGIRNSKFPYEPKWGKGTKGFKVSDLWIGNEYLEMVRMLREDGGGWVKEWTEEYNHGHRGLICLMLDVEDMDNIYKSLNEKGVQVTTPEWLEFKWFFNLLTRRMPWRNCYAPFFENVPFQIGFQEMKNEEAREFMGKYMVPNSRDTGIDGIYHAIVKGQFSEKDFDMIVQIFGERAQKGMNTIQVDLDENQTLEFVKADNYEIELFTNTDDGTSVKIENVTIHH